MKYLSIISIPCMAVALLLTGCNDTSKQTSQDEQTQKENKSTLISRTESGEINYTTPNEDKISNMTKEEYDQYIKEMSEKLRNKN